MTEDPILFVCSFSLPGMTGCSRLRSEMIVRMKKFLQQRFSIVQRA